jgi:hypothetical protein
MTDYTKSTGSTGTMMIRDVGDGWVEFWLKAGSSTFNHDLPWAYVANGVSSSWQKFDFVSGGAWQKIAWFWITTSQTVTFKLGNTGTSGLGGPTDFNQYIFRAGVPSPPSTPSIGTVSATSVALSFTDGANNGASIDARQVGYGTDPSTVQYTTNTGNSVVIGALSSGVTWYFWARTHNSVGWSGWGGRASATTLRTPDAPSRPAVTNIQPTTADISFTPNGSGGTAITSYEVGYGTSSSGPTFTVTASASPKTLTGLTPGTVYFVWVRAINSVGAGPWSTANSFRTVAGAYIRDGGIYKIAVPYVRVGGVWKLAQPYVKSVGVWKTTN